jgi:hypothetical protein
MTQSAILGGVSPRGPGSIPGHIRWEFCGQYGTGICFSLSALVFTLNYFSTAAHCSCIILQRRRVNFKSDEVFKQIKHLRKDHDRLASLLIRLWAARTRNHDSSVFGRRNIIYSPLEWSVGFGAQQVFYSALIGGYFPWGKAAMTWSWLLTSIKSWSKGW